MTVDECTKAVFGHVLGAVTDGPTNEGYERAAEAIRVDLRAFLLCETVRAANECKALAEELVEHRNDKAIEHLIENGPGTAMACYQRILRTSPGSKGDR